MFEYLVLALALFVIISAVVMGFILFPWFFLLLFLLVPLSAVLMRGNMSLPGEQDETVTPSIAASWAMLGVLGLAVLLIGLPAIFLGIWLHPFFFLILLLFSLLLALPMWLSITDPANVRR